MQIWQALGVNLAVVSLFVSIWVNLSGIMAQKRQLQRQLVFGALMCGAAIATMMNAVEFEPGMLIDLRWAILAVTAWFGGPVAVVLTFLVASAFRLYLGGVGVVPGIAALAFAAAIGLIGWLFSRRGPSLRQIATMALGAAAFIIGTGQLAPAEFGEQTLHLATLPSAFLNGFATLAAGYTLLQVQRNVEDRLTLRAALLQSPDYFSIKNAKREYIAANKSVARYFGFSNPEDLIGRTHEQVVADQIAEDVRAEEEEILATGIGVLGAEHERVCDGQVRLFNMSRVPLRNASGEVIGIVLTSKDITDSRQLEQEVRANRDLLLMVTSEMSDGLSMFDANGTMVFCNRLGRELFPLTQDVRVVGNNLRDMLRAAVRTGEQTNLPEDIESWIEEVMAGLRTPAEQELQLADGRWLHLRNRPTDSGNTIVVVSDISSLKAKEAELISLTSQLRLLAATDSLTGLINRRAFDATLASRFEEAAEADLPVSVLMVDVDNFKAFNDLYGHLKGDDCLKIVAQCLEEAVRNTDIVGRFGGEEFVALLPGASADQARQVAERLRVSVAERAIPHTASPTAVVTVSVGVACRSPDSQVPTAAMLLERADQALYAAKHDGKDRVTLWSPERAGATAAA